MSDVSVVIPVFNGARYLGAAIESALTQTLAPAAVIVVDDGSDDDTPSVARQFAARIHYLRKDHVGAAAARNAGQALVKTELLAFLDADDLWVTNKLERQMPLLNGAAMVFGHAVQFISPDLSPGEAALLKCDKTPTPVRCCSALLMRNRDFAVGGGFDPALRFGEFMGWYARAAANGIKPIMLEEVVFHRRLHNTNTGRSELHRRTDYAKAMKAVLDLKRAGT